MTSYDSRKVTVERQSPTLYSWGQVVSECTIKYMATAEEERLCEEPTARSN